MTRDRAATLLVAALAVVAISAAIGSVVAVWPGSHGLRSAAGSYAALADAALRGESPGHDQGRSFLTTYYFPPFPLVIAAAKRIGLGWLGALRLASLLSGLCLLIAAAWLARALGAGARGAWLACALVIACYPVKATLLDARADLLAAAFSLAALAAWSRDEEARGWSVPLLSAASLMIKATSFTLPVAFIAVWHWRRRSGLLVRFGGRFLIAIVVGIAVMVPFHGPAWYADSARALFLHSGGRSSFVRGPAELLRYLGSFGELAILGALAGAWLMRRDPGGDRPGAPITAFALLCVTYAIIVMMNFESGENHLVELSALLATLAAIWAAPRLTSAGALPAIAISIAVLGASWRDLETTLRHARTPQNLETRLSATLRAENGAVFTEDALPALSSGRRPLIADTYAWRSLFEARDPQAIAFAETLSSLRPRLLVLNDDPATLELRAASDPIRALFGSGYGYEGSVDAYHLYRAAQGRNPALP